MKEKNEELKSEEVKNPTQEVDSKEVVAGHTAELETERALEAFSEAELEKERALEEFSEAEESTDSPKEFKIPLEDSERKHYENIIASQKESIRKLREENMELHSKLDSTKTE